jgi:microcystin-dependent protein
MAQHDYSIANQTASNARTDINNALSAIVSNNSGASAPSTTYANMWWYDSSTNKLKIRNEANTAWIEVGELNQTANTFNGGTPAGAVMTFAMSTAPSGWLKCNGAAVSRTTYAKLFAAIGTTYGNGDGSTTFNLPELRGEFVRGWDDGRAVDSGRTLGSTQSDEVGPHTHPHLMSRSDSGALNGVYTPERFARGGTNYETPQEPSQENDGTETRPRNVALNYCIKY